ncbi:MAG: hypothetical protein VB980_04275, partial [Opitutales bacterium]
GTYSIRAKVADDQGDVREQAFTINAPIDPAQDSDGDGFPDVVEIAYGSDRFDPNSLANAAPVSLTLNGSSLAENQPIGAIVGEFNATDPDEGSALTITLIDGAGSTHNHLFATDDGNLRTAAAFDFEGLAGNNVFSIRTRLSDEYNASIAQTFTITVTDEPNEGNDPGALRIAFTEGNSLSTLDLNGSRIAVNHGSDAWILRLEPGMAWLEHKLDTGLNTLYEVELAENLVAVSGAMQMDPMHWFTPLKTKLFRFESNGTLQALGEISSSAQYTPNTSIELDGNFLAVGHFEMSRLALHQVEVDGTLPQTAIEVGAYTLGTSVSLSGDLLASGAPRAGADGYSNVGLVNLFRGISTEGLDHYDEIEHPEPSNNALFGTSVSLSGNLLAIGAPGDTTDGLPNAGSVYLYRIEAGAGPVKLARLQASTPATEAFFGHSLELRDGLLLVGAPGEGLGAVHFFTIDGSGVASHSGQLTDPDGAGEEFGEFISLFGERSLIGNPGTGTAYLQNLPQALVLAGNGQFQENLPVGSVVGQLQVISSGSSNFQFGLVAGTGDDDNSEFTLDGAN